MRNHIAFTLALALSTALQGQTTTAYRLRPVVVPDMTIGGQALAACVEVTATAINDEAEIAFATYCEAPKVFTTKRLVVSAGEIVDGHVITPLSGTALEINNHGQVAYEALYTDANGKEATGIFVDRHFVVNRSDITAGLPFTLTEDGQIVFQPKTVTVPSPSARPTRIPRVHIKGLPNLPLTITPEPRQRVSPLPMLPANAKGEMAIPVNLSYRFVILLATPGR